MRKPLRIAIIVLALSVVPAGAAVGPYQVGAIDGPPGIADAAGVSYTTSTHGGRTTLTATSGTGKVLRHVDLAGDWGIPVVTTGGTAGGLSHDGKTLVLSSPSTDPNLLRTRSRFAVVDAKTLAVRKTVSLRGDFGYDALAPKAATLYLIQHISQANLNRYEVRAYDLRTWQLDPRVIADKSEGEWVMSGQPAARATSANGRWIYTLYAQTGAEPFVHALDSLTRTAVCIDVPWPKSEPKSDAETAQVTLTDGGRKLTIAGNQGYGKLLVLDTRTLRFVS